jgi:hypothetical protein
VIGFFEGASKMSGMRLKIRLNSIFNNCGRRGALTGNAFGLFAMMFTFTEGALEYADVEHYMHQIGLPRSDFAIPAIAAGLTGMMYRFPAASKSRVRATCACLFYSFQLTCAPAVAVSAPRHGLLTLIAAGAVGATCMAGISVLGPKVFGDKAPFGF